jgi:PAS domain-containing protein
MAKIVPPKALLKLLEGSDFQSPIQSLLDRASEILADNKLPFFPSYTDHGINHVTSVMKSEVELVPKEVWQQSSEESNPRLLCDADAAVIIGDNALLLDRLRSEGKIAEQPEWRRWKENLLAAYRSSDPQEDWWHLPDGRTIRVVANPQPNGGVTWVFENLTEKIDLESRYQTAVRVQGETLDNLAEGVAVFGPDGRVRLSNPAFSALWGLEASLAVPGTHISAIRAACDGKLPGDPWAEFVAAVTGFDDERRNRHGQMELTSGTVLRRRSR